MQKLHLVGFTTDHEGLILSARRGARSGGYVLAVDDAIEEAIDDLRARRAEDEAEGDSEPVASRSTRVESTLPVREIQARLRQGRSIADVAKAAGVDAEWVERFAPPVLAERARVIAKVKATPLRRARLGPSVLPVGDAVRHHLADRGMALTADEFDRAWTARQLADGRWAVRFGFHYRGRNQMLQFDLDEAAGAVAASDRLSGQFGYVTPPPTTASRARRATRSGSTARPTVKRAVVTTGFRPDRSPAKAVSRPAKERERAAVAMRKGAAQRVVEAERAAARRGRERAAAARRKEREDKVRAAQAARDHRERAALAAAKAREVAAKKAAAKKAAAAKAKARAVAAKEAAAARKAAPKKAATSKKAATTAKATSSTKKAPAPTKAVPPARTPAPTRTPAATPTVRHRPAARPPTASVTQPPRVPVQPSGSPPPAAAPVRRPYTPVDAPPVRSATVTSSLRPRPPVPGRAPTIAGPRVPGGAHIAGRRPVEPSAVAQAPRPQFRSGLVEQAAEEQMIQERLAARRAIAEASIAADDGSSNGLDEGSAQPLLGRRRRTPLRAT